MKTYVFDAFALLSWLKGESGANNVVSLLREAEKRQVKLLMCIVNLGEVIYRTLREYGQQRAEEVLVLVQALPIEFVDADRSLALSAAAFKGAHRMSYADCFAAALAQRESATVVTRDPHFHQVEGPVAVEWLPSPE